MSKSKWLQRDEAVDVLRWFDVAEEHIQPSLDAAVRKSPEPSISIVYQISVTFDREAQCFDVAGYPNEEALRQRLRSIEGKYAG